MAVTIQLRGDTAANWTSVNPILAERELGIETDTLLYKIGNGVTAWNSLSYTALRLIDDATVINFTNQSTPALPAADSLNLYARTLAGRMMLRQQGPSGITTPFQPAFFQNNIQMINTNTTTTVTSIGDGVTTVGTISHPAVTETYGRVANIVSGASAGNTAGTGFAATSFLRGSVAGGASGFFFAARVGFPDASYNETGASTGSRIFVGLTSGTLAASVGGNDPAGSHVGFQRLHVNGSTTDTNWHIYRRDGVAAGQRTDTGLVFSPQNIYDFYLFAPPNGTTIGWRIDNLNTGASFSGEISTALPTNTTLMRAGFQVQTVNALARNVNFQRVYCESDR